MPEPKSSSDDAIHQQRALDLRMALRERDWKELRRLLGGGSGEPEKARVLFHRASETLPAPWLRKLHPEFLELASEDASDLEDVGVLFFQLECLPEAEQSFRRALVLEPSRLRSLLGLANCLVIHFRLTEARSLLESARVVAPSNPEILATLANVYLLDNEVEEALAAYQLAEEQGGPNAREMGKCFVVALNYLSDVTAVDLKQAGQEWEERYAPPVARRPNEPRASQRRLRVGYYSPDFRNHSISYFLRPILREHDRERFEIFLYSDTRFHDPVTTELRNLGDHWRDLLDLRDDQVVERMKADQLDLLIDLTGFLGASRPQIFAARPAPVQAHLLGYIATTGLGSLDYRFSDAICDPPERDHESSEKVIRLDPGFHCFEQEPTLSLSEGEAPCNTASSITFGSFNTAPKLNDEVLETWCAILEAVPGSRLLIKAISLTDRENRERMVARFMARGIAEERIEVLAGAGSKEEHLKTYRRVDIALDAFPFNGITTTCEALWMGVPVLTLLGERHSGRAAASLLTQIGLTEGIATSLEDYVKTAVAWAENRERIAEWRRTLRQQMANSPLGQAKAYVRKLEEAYLEIIS